MGILDLHFHESEFTFAPSMSSGSDTMSSDEQQKGGKLPKIGLGRSRSTKDSKSTTESSRSTSTETSESEKSTESSGGSKAKKGIGAIVGLAFLVGIALLVKQRRGGQESDDMDDEYGTDEYGSDSTEESIEIAD